MKFNYLVFLIAVVCFLTTSVEANQSIEKVEESTKSPLDNGNYDDDSSVKTSTEKPPISIPQEVEGVSSSELPDSPKRTVADFIIHPLIALKPRTTVDDSPVGKQASTSTLSSPWTIFGFNPGQSIGSLAGSVSGWISDRIPSFVDTPVRGATTTTTPRPEVVVHPTHNPNRKIPNRPDLYQDVNGDDYDDDEDFEYEDDEVGGQVYNTNNRIRPNFGGLNGLDNEDDEEFYDDYEEEDNDFVPAVVRRPHNRLRPGQNNQNVGMKQQRRLFNLQRQQAFSKKHRLQQVNHFHDDDEDEDDNVEENFFYNAYPTMKRSQNSMSFIQHGQRNLMNQFRQLRRGQAPLKPQRQTNKRRKQPTPSPNRNRRPTASEATNKGGQKYTVINSQLVKPQFAFNKKRVQLNGIKQRKPQSQPLHTQLPAKQNNQPAQFIAIPWSQLNIAPKKGLHSFGLQALGDNNQLQPIILNIPQSAIDRIQKANQKKQPVRNVAEELQALPSVSQVSMINRMKPIRAQPVRTNNNPTKNPKVVGTKGQEVMENKPDSSSIMNMPPIHRVRPESMLETIPAESSAVNITDESDSEDTADSEESNIETNLRTDHGPNMEREFIVIGDDDEPGVIRHVQPVYGSERLVEARVSPYFHLLNRQHKTGRELKEIVEAAANEEDTEQKNPIEIDYEEKHPEDEQSIKSEQE